MALATKFRAFQLETSGSLFSYYKGCDNVYTLIEARLPKGGIEVLKADLHSNSKLTADTLHITSWDNDHCNYDDLVQILNHLKPALIEVPHYVPTSDNGRLCYNLITGYDRIHEPYKPNVRIVSSDFLRGLVPAKANGTNDIAYHSKYDTDNCNDKSLVRLFRSSGFNVLSLGDMECADQAKEYAKDTLLSKETDVLILPHHGAHNGFITADFLNIVRPRIAICSSNWGNQYDHPKQEIRNLLAAANIPLFTTKAGDVVIIQSENETQFGVHDFMTNNEYKNPQETYPTKKYGTNAVDDAFSFLFGN